MNKRRPDTPDAGSFLLATWAGLTVSAVGLVAFVAVSGTFRELTVRPLTNTALMMYGSFVALIVGFIVLALATSRVIARGMVMEAQARREAARIREEAAAEQSRFIRTVSHEIRTPLNAVIGMANMLDDGTLDDDQRERASIIQTSGRHLLGLVNDVLDMGGMAQAGLVLEDEWFDIAICIEDALEVCEASLGGRTSLAYRIDPDVPVEARGDARRLRQVLVNLVANAIRNTDEGSVVIRCTIEKGLSQRLHFTVNDTGTGISLEAQERLFDAYTTFDQGGGAGLGLAIVKQIVTAMDGRIHVVSGQDGTTFVFDVAVQAARGKRRRSRRGTAHVGHPDRAAGEALVARLRALGWKAGLTTTPRGVRAAARRAPDVMLVSTRLIGAGGTPLFEEIVGDAPRTKVIAVHSTARPPEGHRLAFRCLREPMRASVLAIALDEATGATANPAKHAPERPGAQRRKLVLVADDSRVNQRVAVAYLERLGHGAVVVADGKQAVEAVRSGGFDAVLMDLSMPLLDGLEAARRIARMPAPPPVIGVSAHSSREDRERCMLVGMTAYLAKPYSMEQLAAALPD